MAQSEASMEKALIRQLTEGVSQWTYRKDITDEASLWANFREKLNQNNIAALDGVQITDAEFNQIQQFMLDVAATPYKAALWLAGENGEAAIPLTREDASKGTIHLLAVSNREIAGGRSSYEVINQYVSEKKDESDRERRFDVTLLINGMPMIHIELKNQDHPFMDAFRQIKKYSLEGKFRGLFGLVQMFVVSNGTNTRYIAADTGSNLNEKFLTSWVNKNNDPVENYLEFAKEVLRIPEAHEMVGHYSVVDSECKKLILLRPYQVHAIEAVKKASAKQESGFVWHTTGSGKTLTSYTVTKNLLMIPGIDKAIFLIDRKDLDQQTSTSFKAYAENDIIDVDDTDNTGELFKKLLSADRQAIVTTIQKMQIVMKRCMNEKNKESSRTKKLRGLRIGFVVDECHRTVTPETQRNLKKFFSNSLWYGFTGTPIFTENERMRKGDLPRTTEQLFGPCLHRYTIKEALHNNAVLGFHIEYKDTISQDQKCDMGEKLGVGSYEVLQEKSECLMESQVLHSYQANQKHDAYDSDEHRLEVIDCIINKCAGKFNLNAPLGEAYEAILTVGSIAEAQTYYKLIKDFVADGKVKESIKARVSDFPRVAITYTVTENDEGSVKNQALMRAALDDYNKMFHTKFAIDDLRAYNTNLNDRLARKKGQYKRRENQLDIVIVVDRLLTGFDAPPCAILFVDRPPMSPQGLIQAFSRTNRIFDRNKRYGMIVIFQRSEQYKQAVDEALLLYSNGGTNDVSAPSFQDIEKEFKSVIRDLRTLAKHPEDADSLPNKDVKRKFCKVFQRFDTLYGEMQVYDEWNGKELLRDYGIQPEEIQEYAGRYHNVLDELKRGEKPEDEQPLDIDIGYELMNVKTATIDYRYLIALIQTHIPDEDVLVFEDIEDKNIEKYIDQLSESNPSLAAVIRQFWEDMKAKPESYRGVDAMSAIEQRIDDIIRKQVEDFTKVWCTNINEVLFLVDTLREGAPINLTSDYDKYREHCSNDDEVLSKLQYKRRLKDAVVALVKKVRPLRDK